MHSGGFASASALLNGGAGKEGGRKSRGEQPGEKPGDAAVRGAERKKEQGGLSLRAGLVDDREGLRRVEE